MPGSLRSRLQAGKPCIGGWLTIPSVTAADALAGCGFHWLAIDFEHTSFGLETAEACIIAAERWGVAPLARLPHADPFLARRLLDIGAVGLIIPAVENAQAFDGFARHCLYPPQGRRGVGLPRANGYGHTFKAYRETFRPLLIPQIESRKGVESTGDLARADYVDAFFVGPYDLSEDLGAAGDFGSSQFVSLLAKARAAAAAHGKPFGIHQVKPDPEELRERISEGYRFVAYGTDVIALRAALGRPVEIVESL